MDPSEDPIPLDRWAVSLDEPVAPPPAPPPASADEPAPDLLRFPGDPDVPSDEYQPRLIRFGKAG